MRRDVTDLRNFYATPLGRAAWSMIGARVNEAWEDVRGLDVLGLGYATPFLEDFRARARRAVAAMPAAQGVEVWPTDGKVASCLASEAALPFRNAFFDRILMIHALEESENELACLIDACRVLAPAGRLIVVAANRRGGWSNAEATPFGHGRPFTRGQLERLVREAGLEPVAWSRALYAPPWPWAAPWAEGFEQAGAKLWPMWSGVILMEAVKQTFAVRPRGAGARVRAPVGGLLAPGLQPAPRRTAGHMPETAAKSTVVRLGPGPKGLEERPKRP
jgi:SAM-dependent methyltransferase